MVFFTSGCNEHKTQGGDISLDSNKLNIEDLISKSGQESANIVYIEENSELAAYLVLTSDYNGNCLLLRERLLDSPMRFNPAGWYAAYYENSEIDLFLNGAFYESLSKTVADIITNSAIQITDKDSLGIGGKNITSINRKVFLLSYSEVNESGSRTNLKEGIPLGYFSDKASRIAYYDSGEAGSWWLRTPNTADTDVVCGVNVDGAVGVGGIGGTGEIEGEYVNGVRPAFCLPRDTILEIESLNGKDIYVISQ